MARGTRGSGMRNRGNRTTYVNPNPSNNQRGEWARKNRNQSDATRLTDNVNPTNTSTESNRSTKSNTFSSRVASGAQTYRYPKSYMDDRRDYLEIRAIKHKYSGAAAAAGGGLAERSNELNKPGASQTQWYMYLPMPQDILDNNTVGWNEDKVNSLAAAGIGGVSDFLGGK